ncbi:MAG: hypothetical protein HYW95_00045 [Candidatus Wildermuthbacteria bacterium]|nr:hypothetical protein [Candidatus Wildermuthbacteria bacterium]
MEYSVRRTPKSKIEIEIVLSPQELKEYEEKALEVLRKNLSLEGFRPGNVPLEIARKELGESPVLEKAAKDAISESYVEVIGKENLDVIGEPEIMVKKFARENPFIFTVAVSIVPEVALPDYKKIAKQVERKNVAVQDQEIEDTLRWLQSNRKQEGEEKLPELDDEFAKSLGEFENMDGLRTSIRAGLTAEKETQEKERVRQEILNTIAKETKVEVPDVLIEQEKHLMLENTKQGTVQMFQITFEEYLKKINKSEEELLQSFRQEAEKRVKNSLILRAIIKKENIEASAQEVEEEVNKALQRYKTPQAAEKEIDLARLVRYMKSVIENEKTLRFLEEFVQK